MRSLSETIETNRKRKERHHWQTIAQHKELNWKAKETRKTQTIIY